MDSARHAGSEGPSDPNEFAIAVGESIRSARQERGWTQAQLAERAELSANYVARLGQIGITRHRQTHRAKELEDFSFV